MKEDFATMEEFLAELFAALGISAATATDKKDALKKIILAPLGIVDWHYFTDTEAIEEIRREWIGYVVDQAEREDKLAASEKDWALEMIGKEGLVVFESFIAHRSKVNPLMARLSENKKDEVRIDELQESINRQLSVSPEIFKKYNPPRKEN